MPHKELLVDFHHQGDRLDVYLAQALTQNMSRSQVQKLIKDGSVQVNGKTTTSHYRVREGETMPVCSMVRDA